MKRTLVTVLLTITALPVFAGPAKEKSGPEKITLTLAAAASLKNAFDGALIPAYASEAGGADVQILPTYDSSGKLQTQIENGLDADIFMSASVKQMNALVEGGYIDASDVVNLLQNRLVLIKRKDASTAVTGFEDITKAASIAIGDPASVPAGQYAKEALTKLGVFDEVNAKASLATNVTEALGQVAAGSAEVGIVYATDAKSEPGVEVIASADGLLENPVIYPVAVLKTSKNREAALNFVKFLSQDAALAVFSAYGFSKN